MRALLRKLPIYDSFKIDFILAYLGHKRATEVLIGRIRYKKPDTKSEQKKNEVAFTQLCAVAGLYALRSYNRIVGWDKVLWYIVARAPKDAQYLDRHQTLRRSGQLMLGRMYGFPDTAARAYARGQKHLVPLKEPAGSGIEELPDTYVRDPRMAFLSFRLSRAHWKSELKTVYAWAEAIQTFDPVLYARTVQEYKKRLAHTLH